MEYDEAALQEVRETRLLIEQFDAWLFSQIEPYIGDRVLEIGCGMGNLLRYLQDRTFVMGIDTSAESVMHVTETLAKHDAISAQLRDVTSKSAVSELSKYQFDTAISLNVLEHVENDRLALENINKLLMPNGRLILIVPSHMFLYGTMDRSIGHFRRYAKGDLAHKLQVAGFVVEEQRYVNALGALGWLINGRVLRKRVPPTGQLRMFNALMPLVTAVESRIEAPFGNSLLSVARRSTN